MTRTETFKPGQFLTDGHLPELASKPHLLILNQPIAHFAVLSRLWGHTQCRICVDGGANRLYDMFSDGSGASRADYLPAVIHGDLDSLREDVRDYYRSNGVDVSQDHDQNSTDFGKAMQLILSRNVHDSQIDVVILCTLAGRVDQGLGLLHEMIREETKQPKLRLWLFSESSVSFILRPAHNIVQELMSTGVFTRNIGLIPLYGPATVTTSGLEWDVRDWPTEMGHQVSTSNHVVADSVEVDTDRAILFTIEQAPITVG